MALTKVLRWTVGDASCFAAELLRALVAVRDAIVGCVEFLGGGEGAELEVFLNFGCFRESRVSAEAGPRAVEV